MQRPTREVGAELGLLNICPAGGLRVVLEIATDVLLVVVLVAAIYSLMSGKPKHRRSIAQRIALLAMSGVLLSEAHTRSGWSHWMNLGIGVFGISCVVFQVVWDRRRNPS
jgi:hypothetical protein